MNSEVETNISYKRSNSLRHFTQNHRFGGQQFNGPLIASWLLHYFLSEIFPSLPPQLSKKVVNVEPNGSDPFPPHSTGCRSGFFTFSLCFCLPQIHKMMADCWNKDPGLRPTFKTLINSVESVREAKEGWGRMSLWRPAAQARGWLTCFLLIVLDTISLINEHLSQDVGLDTEQQMIYDVFENISRWDKWFQTLVLDWRKETLFVDQISPAVWVTGLKMNQQRLVLFDQRDEGILNRLFDQTLAWCIFF